MTEALTSLSPQTPEVSKATPLPEAGKNSASFLPATHCKTFGEKAFSGVFDWGINFGLNLAVSAAFTHWFSHSSRPIWKNASFGESFFHKSPEHAYNWVRDGIMNRTGLSRDVASRMTDALTLTTGGHLIMVPSVWLGAKCKAGFVESVDNWYYGKDKAKNDPWLQARHEAVIHEAKPTFAGTVVGRFGTVLAVQLTSFTLGAKKNLITKLGDVANIQAMKEFKGLNSVAGSIGHAIGEGVSDALPKFSGKMNAFTRQKHFILSTEQVDDALKLAKYRGKPIRLHTADAHEAAMEKRPAYKRRYEEAFKTAKEQPYSTAVADYSKYTALDTLYTIVTMFTIHPIINMAKSVLPGMTYHDQPATKPDTQVSTVKSAGKIAYPEQAQGVSA